MGSAILASAALGVLVRDLAAGEHAISRAALSHLARYRHWWKVQLGFVRSTYRARQVLVLQATMALGALLLAPMDAFLAGLCAIFFALPFGLLQRARTRRVRSIEKQVEPWLGNLARALEAAPSLGEALHATSTASPSPMREELELVLSEMQLGLSLSQALFAWERRVNNQVLSLALLTLHIGRQTGGSLPKVLKDAADALREMERLQGVVRVKTAEGRAQSWVIGGLPVPLYFVMDHVAPHHFDPLRSTSTGHLLVVVAALLWVGALFSAKKVLAVRL